MKLSVSFQCHRHSALGFDAEGKSLLRITKTAIPELERHNTLSNDSTESIENIEQRQKKKSGKFPERKEVHAHR